jgi:hypothetical protein
MLPLPPKLPPGETNHVHGPGEAGVGVGMDIAVKLLRAIEKLSKIVSGDLRVSVSPGVSLGFSEKTMPSSGDINVISLEIRV